MDPTPKPANIFHPICEYVHCTMAQCSYIVYFNNLMTTVTKYHINRFFSSVHYYIRYSNWKSFVIWRLFCPFHFIFHHFFVVVVVALPLTLCDFFFVSVIHFLLIAGDSRSIFFVSLSLFALSHIIYTQCEKEKENEKEWEREGKKGTEKERKREILQFIVGQQNEI